MRIDFPNDLHIGKVPERLEGAKPWNQSTVFVVLDNAAAKFALDELHQEKGEGHRIGPL